MNENAGSKSGTFAFNANAPLHLFDKSVNNCEPEASTLSRRFGREERLKHPLLDVWREATACVFDDERGVFAFVSVTGEAYIVAVGAAAAFSFFLDRVHAVDDEI